MYLAELPWRRGCSVIRCAPRGLFSFLSVSLIKLHLASLPLASSYSRAAVSSVFCAQNIFFSAQTRGAPVSVSHVSHVSRRKKRRGGGYCEEHAGTMTKPDGSQTCMLVKFPVCRGSSVSHEGYTIIEARLLAHIP